MCTLICMFLINKINIPDNEPTNSIVCCILLFGFMFCILYDIGIVVFLFKN